MIEMDRSEKDRLEKQLNQLPLGGWQYYKEIGSTNDAAMQWARDGAPDWSIIVADSQKQGRGRGDRLWITRPGVALALSLIFKPVGVEQKFITRFTALGALGVIFALSEIGLNAKIKWPNDVLLAGQKAAGILVEGDWEGGKPASVVVGIGVNIKKEAVPDPEEVRYPATSVETIYGHHVDRWRILSDIIRSMQKVRPLLTSEAFISEWNRHLAFRGEWIKFKPEGKPAERMRIEGVKSDGTLLLTRDDGEAFEAVAGEIVVNK